MTRPTRGSRELLKSLRVGFRLRLETGKQSSSLETLESFPGNSHGSSLSEYGRRKPFSYRHILHFQSNPGMATMRSPNTGWLFGLNNFRLSRGWICTP
jgi:hypothetical protein